MCLQKKVCCISRSGYRVLPKTLEVAENKYASSLPPLEKHLRLHTRVFSCFHEPAFHYGSLLDRLKCQTKIRTVMIIIVVVVVVALAIVLVTGGGGIVHSANRTLFSLLSFFALLVSLMQSRVRLMRGARASFIFLFLFRLRVDFECFSACCPRSGVLWCSGAHSAAVPP